LQNITLYLPAEVNNLAEEEGGTKYGQDKAEWVPDSKEDRSFYLHAPSLQVVRYSSYQKPLSET
jgi:hypothetical protein